VLKFNRTHQPEIILIGDSICHYWGGEPVAPKAWAADVWQRTFAGWSVENLVLAGIAPKMFSGASIMVN